MGEGEAAAGFGGQLPGYGWWGWGGASEVLLGGTLGGELSRGGEVIGEGMFWERAVVEVGVVGCGEGGLIGVEIGVKLGVL